MFQKTIGGLAVLVATATGCGTPPATIPAGYEQPQKMERCGNNLRNLFGEQIRAGWIAEHIGRYMLIGSNGTPYASLRSKCGECPVRDGFVAVYEDEAAAHAGSAFLSPRLEESFTPTPILRETIEEHITLRYTSGRRIEPEKGPVDLKPL